ncbi:MAG: DNA polymerase IV [Candidatus Brockarchaeota archaeon]|nr:DNA polymerase IV [Candidatus Brockarchaeota archaeon]MBO3808334.1 DNA polymerase IV [Candidatus Brockarchaeota archaeon]
MKPVSEKQVSPRRVILLVDLDYFFAQCEEARNPSLRNKPVVVCIYSGRSGESGVISTANYEARKHGVKSGIPISLAKKRLMNIDAVFLPVDHEYYKRVSDEVMSILKKHADFFEQAGVDEAYLDVSERVEGDFDRAVELARRMKEEVRRSMGLTCSIGIGPNKLVAKIAADFQKPDGLTVVKPEEVQRFLSQLPVNRLIGVGVKTQSLMESLGIKTIGDLASYDVRKLIELFGEKLGVYFHNASRGIDNQPVKERGEASSISRIATLKEDTRNLEAILKKTSELCDEIHAELLRRGLRAKQVGIIVITKDMAVHNRSKTLEQPTSDPEAIKKNVRGLFGKLLREPGLEARRVGVRVSGFVKEEGQKQLRAFIPS